MPLWQNVSGTWKNVILNNKVSATWKTAVTLWNNVLGVWKLVTNLFDPVGGTYNPAITIDANNTFTINCIQSATWTYSGGGTGGSVNVASGASATSITFTVTPPPSTGLRTLVWTIQGQVGAQIENYNLTLRARTT